MVALLVVFLHEKHNITKVWLLSCVYF